MNIFYSPSASVNQYCVLDETESRHVATVLRKKVGDELQLFDGKGNLFKAQIQSIGKKEVSLQITSLQRTETAPSPALHIAIAAPKNIERFEWFCEKVTEIGVSEITPLVCEHSERKELRHDRIEKILLSACKQSFKFHLPGLNPVIRFSEFVSAQQTAEQKLLAYCDEKSIHLKTACLPKSNTLILIGPEGDFSKEEIELSVKNGYKTVSLGKSRLRLETAGIFAATVFNLANE